MESLEKQLICPICLETFTKPVVILPCQHNLCRKCADDVFQASNPYLSTRSGSTVTSGGRFRCPSCRHEVVLDRHGVYGLQRNLLVENIIDMYKQDSSSKPSSVVKVDQLMCVDHEDERINIYCVSCSAPTCSLCKVFGAHKDCEVAPLDTVFTAQKAELTDCISMLVGNNERNQAIIGHLEETCRAVYENGSRQKSKLCETFDHLFALLEEKKGQMTLRISSEQEVRLDNIRGLRRTYSEHMDAAAQLLENAIQTLDESEMAVFLQTSRPLLQKIVKGTNTSHLDKLQHGYDNMELFTANFKLQSQALSNISFMRADEDDEEDEIRVTSPGSRAELQPPAAPAAASAAPPAASAASPAPSAANQQPPLPPAQLSAPTTQRPSETTPTITSHTRNPTPSSSSQTTPHLPPPTASSTPKVESDQSELSDSDGQRHVFSFSWLNQK